MLDSIEINLSWDQVKMLRSLSQVIRQTPNISAGKALEFVERCVGRTDPVRFVLREEQRKLQKDIYVGKGIIAEHVEKGAVPDAGDQPPSFHIESRYRAAIDMLIGAEFGANEASVMSRAVWLYRDVASCVVDKSQSWTFGHLRNGEFHSEKLEIGESVSIADVEEASKRIKGAMMNPDHPFDEQAARRYFQCYEIAAEDKIDWANIVVKQRAALQDIVVHLGQTLALNSEEAKRIKAPDGAMTNSASNPEQTPASTSEEAGRIDVPGSATTNNSSE
jgi:hypothetical protein